MSGVRPERLAAAPAGRGKGRAPWVAGTLLSAAVLMFCYLRVAGATQVNSDGAGLEWQAWDVLHGNVLLHGWWATDVSFYTTELPEYLAVTAAAGLRPEVVHICSAVTYTLLVLLAAFVARGRARGAEGLVRAVIAAGVILAPQPTGPTLVLLGNPDHVGTGVPVLVLLLLLDWAQGPPSRRRWWVPVAAGALLAWSIIGDPLIEVVGSLPLFLACALRAGWIACSQRPDPGPPRRRRWSAARYELSLAAAAIASVPVAAAGNWLIRELGGFSVAGPWYHLQSLHRIVRGLPIAARSVLVLFGADYKGVSGAGNVAFALVHLIGVAAVLAAFAVAVWGLARPFAALAWPRRLGPAAPGDLVADVLVLAIAANMAAFLLEVPMKDTYVSHEIGPVLALGAALAGRTLGGRILGRRDAAAEAQGAAGPAVPVPAGQPPAGRPSLSPARRGVLAALAAVLAGYAVLLGVAAAHRQAPPRNVGLTAWLTQHHLTSGFGAYWEASSVTVDSGGAITVLSVTDGGPHGRLVPQRWETNVDLAAKTPPATFVIVSPTEKLRVSSAVATFGKPARSYGYGPFTILVWDRNLLPRFAQASQPAPARAASAAS
jgi:hypothetical protein